MNMSNEHSKSDNNEQLPVSPEAAEVEELDLEEFSKMHGGKPPKAKRYIVRIDREKYTVTVPKMTGRQILELAKKLPPENWLLNQKLKGGRVVAVGLNDVVDFTVPGVERFITLPKDQTEGLANPRREFCLPETDIVGLDDGGFNWETVKVANDTGWLLVHEYRVPTGYNTELVSLAVQIPGGYPTAQLDMAFFHPALNRKDGRGIPNTEATATIDGKSWQRWSRHYTSANPWIPGEYNTLTHLALVKHWLEREFQRN